MRLFKTKWFSRFARKESITDQKLCEVLRDIEAGLIDADLGGGVLKQRIARANEGKSGGYRTIVLYRQGEKAFFVFGFAKGALANISHNEEIGFKKLASRLLSMSEEEIKIQIEAGQITEVIYD